MEVNKIIQILKDTAYVRTGGSPEERQAAEYLIRQVAEMGMQAELQSFEVPMAEMEQALLYADGVSIPCKGYLCAGSCELEAPLYYLRNKEPYSFSQCKDKIVLVDGHMSYWLYQDIVENGALGFITYDGNVNYADEDIDQRELRSYVHKGNPIPGVNINAKSAVAMIRDGVKTVKIVLKQREFTADSHNVVLYLPGENGTFIALTAHYDSTSLSQGAYDNMSGSIGLLAIAQHFTKHPHRYGLRFIWCGSEERGLLGSREYCGHEENLKDCVLNINLDMIGCIMGRFIYCVTAEEKLCHYITYFAHERGFGIDGSQDVYSSDSTPFADKGVPAVSFARITTQNTATIHNRYDTVAVMSGAQMAEDIDFLIAFTDRMANAVRCPVSREIPGNLKEKLDEYLGRKRLMK